MKKDLFLSMLKHKLEEGGLPKSLVDESITKFSQHFSGMNEEEVTAAIKDLGGVDKVAGAVITNYQNNTVQQSKTVELPEIEIKKKKNKNTNDLLIDDEEDKGSEPGKAEKFFEDDDSAHTEKPQRRTTAQHKKKSAAAKKGASSAKAKKPGKSETNTKFVIGMIIASPVLLILAMCIAAVFLALYSAVALAVVLFSVLLVLLTALGTAFAVIAVIYGVTQLTQIGGAGLYEMGIGVVAGGITLLCGILMYNFIVRLAPFIFKKLFVLIKFVVAKIKQLYFFAKEACDKI